LLIHTTAVNSQTILGKLLDWKPIAYLGTISYSIYVWQQPFLCFPMNGIETAVVRIAITLIIAALSYHWLEKPFIALGRRLTSRLKRSDKSTVLPLPQANVDHAK
jgi:peptidoglycan/LPS O-acetylase OafA/YrhL